MRILVDENVPGDVVAVLVERGHDVAWVRTDSPDQGIHTTCPYFLLLTPSYEAAFVKLELSRRPDTPDRYGSVWLAR